MGDFHLTGRFVYLVTAMKDKARRLQKLAEGSPTLEAFIKRAGRFPKFYGFPGMGSKIDWKLFYELYNKSLDN